MEDQEDLNKRVRIAAFFGTLQAGFTDFHYLRNKWKVATELDALLGIGMTGIASGKVLGLNLSEATNQAILINKKVADLIGINAAARISCVKPSGTTSCVLGTSSGIHAWHNDFYLRTLRFNKSEAIATHIMKHHPALCEDDILRPTDTLCVRFPIRAPKGSILRTETALDTLERVKKFSKEWIAPGHRTGANSHNVSATISIDKKRRYLDNQITPQLNGTSLDEWQAVGAWMWENREVYNGISVLDYDGGSYLQPPFEDISEEQYHERVKLLHNLDLNQVREEEDNVHFGQVAACSGGGACEIG